MKILFLAITYLLTLELSAQSPTYYKMLGDTNRWFVSGFMMGVKPGGVQSTNGIGGPCIGYYQATKDSSYGGKVYKKFLRENSPYPCPYNSTGTNNYLNMCLVREDTLLKKIYIVHPDSVNECVVMDFSMNIGDSLLLPFSPNSNELKKGYYRLDSIVSKDEILGARKHFYLSKYNAPINFQTNRKYYIEWIESIGATHFPINIIEEGGTMDLMSNDCKANQYASYVTCKFTNSVKFYQDSCALNYVQTHQGAYYVYTGDHCEFYGWTSSLNELSFIRNFELYPNPVSRDHLTLKFDATEFKPIDICIYNNLGEKVYEKQVLISTSNNEIELNDLNLAIGLYTLQIKSSSESASVKFVNP